LKFSAAAERPRVHRECPQSLATDAPPRWVSYVKNF